MDVKVTLAGGSLAQSVTDTVTFSAQSDGTWIGDVTFEDISHGDGYYLLVKGPKHVQKRICEDLPFELTDGTYSCETGEITIDESELVLDFTGIKLLAGDVPPQDGVVDSLDLAIVREIIAQPTADRSATELIEIGDLNFDGIVDSQDFDLIIETLEIGNSED